MDEVEVVSTDDSILTIINKAIERKNETGQDDAFFVVDIDEIASLYAQWKTLLPNIEPFYAVKCNFDRTVLRYMASMGLSFDCASKNEIDTILSLGVPQEKIIYTQPNKPVSHLQFVRSHGIEIVVFDCEEELKKINRVYPSAKLLLRIMTSSKYKSFCHFGDKFGCETEEAYKLLSMAKHHNQDVVGISFHVGCSCQDSEAYTEAIKQSKILFTVGKDVGHHMTILNIGGGYTSEKIKSIAEAVASNIDDTFNGHHRFIAEPGTLFVQTAFTLVVQIVGKKRKQATSDDPMVYHYYLNEGKYGSFGDTQITAELEFGPIGPFPVKQTKAQALYTSILWGPTCDSRDRLLGDYLLPEMEIEDWVYFTRAGAYTKSFQTDFNGISRSECVYFTRNKMQE